MAHDTLFDRAYLGRLPAAAPAAREIAARAAPAEAVALHGCGVTAIQGASGTDRRADEALVRNVDLRVFGQRRARAMIDLPGGEGESQARTQLDAIVKAIGNHEVDAFYLHLAEGQPDDPRSLK